jgi:ABC-type multidrug transport system ATPase subunit
MAGVTIHQVSKSYDGKNKVVNDVSFKADKEFVVFAVPPAAGNPRYSG